MLHSKKFALFVPGNEPSFPIQLCEPGPFFFVTVHPLFLLTKSASSKKKKTPLIHKVTKLGLLFPLPPPPRSITTVMAALHIAFPTICLPDPDFRL